MCAFYYCWAFGLLPLFVMNKAAKNITVYLFWWIDALNSLGYISGQLGRFWAYI